MTVAPPRPDAGRIAQFRQSATGEAATDAAKAVLRAAARRDGRCAPHARAAARGLEARRHHLALAVPDRAPGRAAHRAPRREDQGHLLLRRELPPRRPVVPVALPQSRPPGGRVPQARVRAGRDRTRARTTCSTRWLPNGHVRRCPTRRSSPSCVTPSSVRSRTGRSVGTTPRPCRSPTRSRPRRSAPRGEEEQIRSHPDYVSFAHRHQTYVAQGMYAPMLERWFAAFPREQVTVLAAEEFYADPQALVDELCGKLSLPTHRLSSVEPFNAEPSAGMDPDGPGRALRAHGSGDRSGRGAPRPADALDVAGSVAEPVRISSRSRSRVRRPARSRSAGSPGTASRAEACRASRPRPPG